MTHEVKQEKWTLYIELIGQCYAFRVKYVIIVVCCILLLFSSLFFWWRRQLCLAKQKW